MVTYSCIVAFVGKIMLSVRRGLVCALIAFSGGCGLIDPDIASVDLSLPEKELVVDADRWQLASVETLPAVDCSSDSSVCTTGISDLCAAPDACSGTCGSEATCEVSISVSLWHGFDLAAEKPELQEIEGQPLVSIDVKRIAYKVTENTLNVATVPINVYAAPGSVMSASDPTAELIGTIPSVAPETLVEDDEVELTPDGRKILARFMKNYSVPFNILLGTDLTLKAGDIIPTGRMTAVVMASATAGF